MLTEQFIKRIISVLNDEGVLVDGHAPFTKIEVYLRKSGTFENNFCIQFICMDGNEAVSVFDSPTMRVDDMVTIKGIKGLILCSLTANGKDYFG